MVKRHHNILDYEFEDIINETENAWLILIREEEIWFPKSQVEVDEDNNTISMPEWLATEKGL